MARNNQRYICSFVKEINGEFQPNVVVITAPNNVIARAMLCQEYTVVNIMIDKDDWWRNNKAGIKNIRLSDTNTYVDDEGNISHDP